MKIKSVEINEETKTATVTVAAGAVLHGPIGIPIELVEDAKFTTHKGNVALLSENQDNPEGKSQPE